VHFKLQIFFGTSGFTMERATEEMRQFIISEVS